MKPTVHVDNSLLTLESSKRSVETYLTQHFTERVDSAHAMDPSYKRLWQSVEQLFHAGGKRIRPYITLLAYQAYASDTDISAILPAAAAQELLHLAMLIHDDIIDRDRTRYGVKNVTGQYESHYETAIAAANERRHYADSAAILAGDLLLSDAYELLSRCKVDPRFVFAGQRILNEAVFTVVGGELLDTETAFTDSTLVRPIEVARFKTASYSFVSPLMMGATFAGASEHELTVLKGLGESVGIAYQMQDDILGMFGSSELTGKSVTSDLEEGKFTHLIELFRTQASQDQILAYETLAGRPDLSEQDVRQAKQLLVESGAKQALENDIEELRLTTESYISQLSISSEYKAELSNLLTTLMQRDK